MSYSHIFKNDINKNINYLQIPLTALDDEFNYNSKVEFLETSCSHTVQEGGTITQNLLQKLYNQWYLKIFSVALIILFSAFILYLRKTLDN